jgi:hypothetical protein
MSIAQISPFNRRAFSGTLSFFSDLNLISRRDSEQVLSLLNEDFEFAEIIKYAESVHVHVEVDDVNDLPDAKIRSSCVSSVDRYHEPDIMKYSYDSGINVIFSSFPISQDDLVPGTKRAKPFVDHLGVDLRDETPATRAIFDAIPARAKHLGWRHVHQAAPRYCCYTACSEKHWVFPPSDADTGYRPIEFAFGSLQKFDSNMGCDYRPIDPAHPLAGTLPTRSAACG